VKKRRVPFAGGIRQKAMETADIRKAFSNNGYKCNNSSMLLELSNAASQYCFNAKELASRFTAYMLNQYVLAGGPIRTKPFIGRFLSLALCSPQGQLIVWSGHKGRSRRFLKSSGQDREQGE
jgi:hypothetical protein